MSFFDDNEDDIIYGRAPWERGGHQVSKPRITSCTRCGADGLHWDEGELVGLGGRVHKCPAVQASADDFEALP